jgi:hypothetical protein
MCAAAAAGPAELHLLAMQGDVRVISTVVSYPCLELLNGLAADCLDEA